MNDSLVWDDTIVALATPPGVSAIGVIRLSGKKSVSIVSQLMPSKNLLSQQSHTIHIGYLKEHSIFIDEVVVSLFRSPRSYTGEDVVEISCHGSPYIEQQIVQACLNKGARLARAGEFTQRAFLSGKLDLTQAEAVADLIASNTAASHKTAMNNIRGGFSQILRELREQLIRFSALIELELDFSQEDVEFADRSQLYHLVSNAEQTVSELLYSFKMGNVIKNGVQVAIVGKPNAGKSTLLNVLLKENRAIVSSIAGTTRDTIEETINIDGILFRLVDTAGIREHEIGSIEGLGIEKSLQKMQQSDIVIYLFDIDETTIEELMATSRQLKVDQLKYLLVGNKSDLVPGQLTEDKFDRIPDTVFISARQDLGIEILKKKLVGIVLEGNVSFEDTVITNARHYHILEKINRSLQDIKTGLDTLISGDLLALDIRTCLQQVGEITGEITTEDQLDYIFSKFCIGK
ncbi:MAG: tRNA uridine-5-carboxymethylaminomethyl(34) synthesis GTPase MnmE [Chitinophagaceae bacterium]